jgi:multidrug efflux system outer membrane protein
MKARLPATALAALLAGCASMAPPYERPPAPVPERFAADTGQGTPAAELAWQRFFTDARLQRLIGIALAGNRDLRVAVLAIEQARAQAAVRDADLWPTVNAGITGSRQPTAAGGIASLYTAGAFVSAWELDLFGRLRSASDAAAAQVLASSEARKAVHIGLLAAVANADLALRADDALLRVTQQTLRTRQESLRLTRLRHDNGAGSLLDLRSAESLLEAARASLAQQARQRAQDANALGLLLGQPLPADLAAGSDAGTDLPVLPELPAGLPSEVLLQRPDVRQAELQLIAANANIGAARAAFFPRITLTGSVGSASGELAGLFKAGSFAWSFAPQLLQPLFDAGRNRANLQASQAARDIAVAQYEKAVQTAFREVADALAGRATLADQARAQAAQVQAEASRVELTELRFRNGASSTLEVLDAQRSLYAAQLALVQVQSQRVQNSVTLYRVLGGGWAADPAAPR